MTHDPIFKIMTSTSPWSNCYGKSDVFKQFRSGVAWTRLLIATFPRRFQSAPEPVFWKLFIFNIILQKYSKTERHVMSLLIDLERIIQMESLDYNITLFKQYYSNAMNLCYDTEDARTWKTVCVKCNTARNLLTAPSCCF
jgi:hypothetical protein